MSDHEMDPTGGIELTDAELSDVMGGARSDSNPCNTFNCVQTRGNTNKPNPCSC